MWSLVTNRVSETRNVIFLQRMYYEGKNIKKVMKDPIVVIQVPCRNKNGNKDSNNESVIQDKMVCKPNDTSGLEARDGTRVTFQADYNVKRPTEAYATEDTTWVKHINSSGQATGLHRVEILCYVSVIVTFNVYTTHKYRAKSRLFSQRIHNINHNNAAVLVDKYLIQRIYDVLTLHNVYIS